MDIFDFSQYFFVIDSDNIDDVRTDLYGYAVQADGIYDRRNMKGLDPEKLEGCGTYVHVERRRDRVILRQDCGGNFGLYLYRKDGYFAISNSFFRLVEHVRVSHEMTINRDYVNQFMATWIVSLSYDQTAVNEISFIPAHEVVTLMMDGSVRMDPIEYGYNTVALDSKAGIALLDQWYEKWLGIIHGLASNTDQICADLSGGMDSRLTLIFLLGSGIDLGRLFIRSLNDHLHTHTEDFKIASRIADTFGFKLNQSQYLNPETENYSFRDILGISFYIKMLSQKELTMPGSRAVQTRYYFGGMGGELVRPYWEMSPKSLLNKENKRAEHFPYRLANEIKNSNAAILGGTFKGIREKYHFTDDTSEMYSFNTFRECYSRNHFGKIEVEAYMGNVCRISPVMDPMLQRLRLEDDACPDRNLLIAVIFDRYCKKLLSIPFDSGRSIAEETLQEAARINAAYPYEAKAVKKVRRFEMNITNITAKADNTFIDKQTKESYVYRYFGTDVFRKQFTAYFPEEFYSYADEFAKKGGYFPYRHVFAVVGVNELLKSVLISQNTNSGFMGAMSPAHIFGDLEDNPDPKQIIEFSDQARIDVAARRMRLVDVSDPEAVAYQPDWYKQKGICYVVESGSGAVELTFYCTKPADVTITLRGIDCRENGQRVPKWVRYTKLVVNDQLIFDEPKLISHDKPYRFEIHTEDEIKIQAEWSRFTD